MDLAHKKFLIALVRAAGGAILFSFPLLMTMEMWALGYTTPAYKMVIFLILSVPLLAGLAYYSGFESPVGVTGSVVDAFVAYAVGFVTSAIILAVFAVLDPAEMSTVELIGKVTLQAMPAGLGAVLASSQLGLPNENDEADGGRDAGVDNRSHDDPLAHGSAHSAAALGVADTSHAERQPDYWRELFLMVAGALFLAFNVAPTEEVMLIAYTMTAMHAVVLMLMSIAIMHTFVYVVQFKGQESIPESQSQCDAFLRFTAVGYALALLVSLFCLWIFGRIKETAIDEVSMMTVVLSFPASLGAAAARLIL